MGIPGIDLKGVETALSDGMGALKSIAGSLERLAETAERYLEQQRES